MDMRNGRNAGLREMKISNGNEVHTLNFGWIVLYILCLYVMYIYLVYIYMPPLGG